MITGELGLSWPDATIISSLVIGLASLTWWVIRRFVRGQFVAETVLHARIEDKDNEIARLGVMFAERLADKNTQIENLNAAIQSKDRTLAVLSHQLDLAVEAAGAASDVVRAIPKVLGGEQS